MYRWNIEEEVERRRTHNNVFMALILNQLLDDFQRYYNISMELDDIGSIASAWYPPFLYDYQVRR